MVKIGLVYENIIMFNPTCKVTQIAFNDYGDGDGDDFRMNATSYRASITWQRAINYEWLMRCALNWIRCVGTNKNPTT